MDLGLGRLGPGLEHVFFGFGLGDLALQGQEALFEQLHLAGLAVELGREGGGGFLAGAAPGQGFLGQVFFPLFQGQLGPFVPGGALALGLLGLVGNALLAGNRCGHGLAQLDQVRLHVSDGLIENLARIFHAA